MANCQLLFHRTVGINYIAFCFTCICWELAC